MRRRTWLAAVLVATLVVPLAADKRGDAKAQVTFGIAVAKANLWAAAVTHWEKAVKIDPTYAAAWNNLAIGYEQLGRFKEAREAYEQALKLDVNNTFIRTNWDQFLEIYNRQNRRRGK
jgi:Flp pilus assembly protein TadD